MEGQYAIADATKVEPSFYETLRRYTLFSAAGLVVQLKRPCPHPPDNSVILSKHIQNVLTNTECTIFRADDTKELIVSFPGTSSAQDFVTDFEFIPVKYDVDGVTCDGCKVHSGFYGSYNSVAPKLEAALKMYLKKYPGYTVTPTGHSLGGALAGFAYPGLKAAGFPVKKVFTFGQPRLGNKPFADFLDKLSGTTEEKVGNYYRTTHTFDGVPNLPSRKMGFHHGRTEFFELDTKSGNQSAARTFRCYGQEAQDCNDGMARGFINQAHLMYTGVSMVGNQGCGN